MKTRAILSKSSLRTGLLATSLAIVAFAFPLPARAQQTFTTFQAASAVAGQADFTSQSTTNSQTVTPGATSAAVSAQGKLAVGAQSSGRVLLWNSIPTTNGAPADVVVGRPDFTSSISGCTPSLTSNVEGVTFSPDGSKLIVCDASNNRVLIWNSVPTTNGQPADVVIGQVDFITSTSGLAANKLSYPSGATVTPGGKLIITELNNNRVLIFNAIPTSNGASADVVVGQASMTSNFTGSGANQINRPWGAAYSSDGKLLISEENNNRVLVFNTLPTTNGQSADVVIGQTGFGVNTGGTSASQLSGPIGVAVSASGQLAIGEFSNNRVLIYNSIPTSNGAAADVVLGQPNFTSNTAFNPGVSAQSMQHCYQLTFAPNGRLIVPGRDMHRAMIFGTASAAPAVTTNPATVITPTGATLNGAVNPNGASTNVLFQYSTDPTFATYATTSTQAIGSGNAVVPVSASLTGLIPRTLYYFRAVATNSGGTVAGGTLSFTTGVVNWGASGGAAGGILDPAAIPTAGTQKFINVNGQGYDIVVTTSGLGTDGSASYFGDAGWWFEGGGPSSGYATVTFRFYDTGTTTPHAVSGIDFRLLDVEKDERFKSFGYWDASNTPFTTAPGAGLVTFSHGFTFHATDGGYENNAPQENGDQLGKWIEVNLSSLAISGFTFQAHRQTSGAGSVIMSDLITPWTAWRVANFGAAPFPPAADDLADPDGDGIQNVMEYFYGTNPNAIDAPSPLQMSVVAGQLTVTFPRNTSATDTTATVEGADSMSGPWTDLARSVNGAPFTALVAGVNVSETGPGLILTVQVSDQYLASDPLHPTRYLRLRVVH